MARLGITLPGSKNTKAGPGTVMSRSLVCNLLLLWILVDIHVHYYLHQEGHPATLLPTHQKSLLSHAYTTSLSLD